MAVNWKFESTSRRWQYGVSELGTLYLLGGGTDMTDDFWGSESSAECYNTTEDKWIKKTTIPVKMISNDNEDAFTGCVLKLSKRVLDKLDVNSN